MRISLPGFDGEVALTRESPYAMLAYVGPLGIFTPGKIYVIAEIPYTVLSVTPSQYVSTILMVRLKEI